MPAGSGPRAARDGFIVSHGTVAKGQVVHASLRGCASFKSPQNLDDNRT